MGLPGTESDRAIVVAILQMAHALGLKVMAEGVETESQRQFLLDSGCDEYQGLLHTAPLDSLSFEKRFQNALAHADAAEVRQIRLVRG
jgi:EAL domain-containing protein (putative c-di-GMP-specific phosphodiesterase class I)